MNWFTLSDDRQAHSTSAKVFPEIDTFLATYIDLDYCGDSPAYDSSYHTSAGPIAQSGHSALHEENAGVLSPGFTLDCDLYMDTTLTLGSASLELAHDRLSSFPHKQANMHSFSDGPTFAHDSPAVLLSSAAESGWSWPTLEGHHLGEGVPTSSAAVRNCLPSRSLGSEAVYGGPDWETEEFVLPVPPLTHKARYAPYSRPHSDPSRGHSNALPTVFSPTTSTSDASSSRTPSPSIIRTRRRNTQTELTPAALEDALRSPSCTCPACGFVPATRRSQDLDRHMQTHLAESSKDKWVCCGVPAADAWRHGIDDTTEVHNWKGMKLVGGCMQSFSRRDALLRHLNKARSKCCGDMDLADRLARQ